MAQGALPGFRDFYPEQFAERAHIMGVWREVARRFAFVEYDGPPLEPLELYTKKSGEEIVGQLYNFTDKGGREISLRPEMTPTLARMAAAKANALRKPVRWFSVPQLFRYERQQRGRLREHFQLNVDIIGETDVTADAELLAVAIEVMRGCGLTSSDVRARISDRRLLRAILAALGVSDASIPALFAVVDKFDRQPRDVSREKLAALGMSDIAIGRLFGLLGEVTLDDIERHFADAPEVGALASDLRRYFECLDGLGVLDWVTIDLKIVRGLAYYTGIVFELFDAKAELRAICGGGRYDNLLQSLGGVDLPALGFGMGDVVLAELLRDRGLLPIEVRGAAGVGCRGVHEPARRCSPRRHRASPHRRERGIRPARSSHHETGESGQVGRRRIRAHIARTVQFRNARTTHVEPARRPAGMESHTHRHRPLRL